MVFASLLSDCADQIKPPLLLLHRSYFRFDLLPVFHPDNPQGFLIEIPVVRGVKENFPIRSADQIVDPVVNQNISSAILPYSENAPAHSKNTLRHSSSALFLYMI